MDNNEKERMKRVIEKQNKRNESTVVFNQEYKSDVAKMRNKVFQDIEKSDARSVHRFLVEYQKDQQNVIERRNKFIKKLNNRDPETV